MTDTTDERLPFPREIWMGDRYEHDQGILHVRAAQDEDHDHRYVDADILDSAEKYWRTHAKAMVAAAYEDAAVTLGQDPYDAVNVMMQTKPDDQAALDALLKAERVRLLREIEVHHALALTGDADGRDCHAFVTDIIEKEAGQ